MKYKLSKCRSTRILLPYAIPALHTPPTWTPSVTCSGKGMRKPTGHGRKRRSLRMMESDITTACETSDPLMPASILMLLVQKVDSRDMYA